MSAQKLTEQQRAQALVERLGGVPESTVARRYGISGRSVRAIIQRGREESSPEELAAAALILRERLVGNIDKWLLEAMAEIRENRQLADLKPTEIAHMMADIGRVRRDIAAAPVPGTGETPAQRIAREQQPELKRESVEEWNARHASYPKPQ